MTAERREVVVNGAGPAGSIAAGLLLGIREFSVSRACFAPGTLLQVDVTETTRDEDSRGVFTCRLSIDGETVAEGRLTVFEPADPWAALAEQIS